VAATQRGRAPRQDRPRRSQQHRTQPHELVRLVSRLMLAQAAVTSAIGLACLRRNITWLLIASMVAVAAALLAGLIRSGTHAAWAAAVTCESALTLIGLVRVATVDYLGGTLLAIATLGVLIHPAVGQAFAAAAGRGQPGLRDVVVSEQSRAGNAGGAVGGGAG
jgi:hypothetical protein